MIGVTVGKFNPPHLGHFHLISAAARRVDRLVVIVADRPGQTLPATRRAAWLRSEAPSNVDVVVTPDDLPDAPEPWARRTIDLLGRPPDAAFTSEPYGRAWADAMGCRHVAVDPDRNAFPISGSEIRADLAEHFRWLLPSARADLVKRVVLVGAESTGKSTMAAALAERLGTVWVPEHGRWYWEGRRFLIDQGWTPDEFLRIARAQRRLETDLARKAHSGVMIADTDALMTSIWQQRYTGATSESLEALAAANAPDLYLVCAPDVPWHQDGTRESLAEREDMHARTTASVTASRVPWSMLTGPHPKRLDHALRLVDELRATPPLD